MYFSKKNIVEIGRCVIIMGTEFKNKIRNAKEEENKNAAIFKKTTKY